MGITLTNKKTGKQYTTGDGGGQVIAAPAVSSGTDRQVYRSASGKITLMTPNKTVKNAVNAPAPHAVGAGRKAFDGDRNGTAKGNGFGPVPGLAQRMGSALSGAGKQYAASIGGALTGLYSMGATAREKENQQEQAEIERRLKLMDEGWKQQLAAGTVTAQDQVEYEQAVKAQRDRLALLKEVQRAQSGTVGASLGAMEELEQLAEKDIDKAKQNLGGVGKLVVDTGVAGSQMLMDVALGGGAAMLPMAGRVFGGGYQEATRDGATNSQALAYGAGSAAVSVLTEKLANVAAPFKKIYGGGWLDDAITKATGKMNTTAAGRIALSALSEAGEEFLEAAAQPVLQRATYDKNAQLDLSEALYSALVGAALGAFGGGVETVTNLRKTEQTPTITEQEATQRTETQTGQDVQAQTQTTAQSAQEAADAQTAPVQQTQEPTQPTRTEGENIHTYGNLQENALNLEESGRGYGVAEEVVQEVKRIADATQRKIVFFDEGETATGLHNGWYDPETGIIGINVRSQNPVAQVIGHELTHSVETAQTYRELSGLVLTRLQRDGKSLEELRSAKKEEYARSGITLSTSEDIDREIVAEYVEKYLLTDEQRIMEFAQNERSLAQKILDWINHLLTKIGVNLDREREFLFRVREAYSEALAATPGGVSTNRRTVNDLRQAWADGEITEEEFDAALDDIMQDESRRGESPLELRHSYTQRDETAENAKKDEAQPFKTGASLKRGLPGGDVSSELSLPHPAQSVNTKNADGPKWISLPVPENIVAESGETGYTEGTNYSTEEGRKNGRKGVQREAERGLGKHYPRAAQENRRTESGSGGDGDVLSRWGMSQGGRADGVDQDHQAARRNGVDAGGERESGTVRRFYAEAERRGQTVRTFERVSKEAGGTRRGLGRFTEVTGADRSKIAAQTQAEFERLGIDCFVHAGDLEVLTRNGKVVSGGDAGVVHKSAVGISNEIDIQPKETAGHEGYHFWRGLPERDEYTDTVLANLDWASAEFGDLYGFIEEYYFNGTFDMDDEMQYSLFEEELVAYISGSLHNGEDLGGMLRNQQEVAQAWQTLISAATDKSPEWISLPKSEPASDSKKQYSVNRPEGLSLPEPEETTASMVDQLPAKARKYLERTERGMVAEIGKALGIQTQDQRHLLEEVVREISEEYLEAGTVSQKKLDDLFNRVYDTRWSEFSTDADRRKLDKHEFDTAVMDAIGDLKNVKRYAEDRQRKAELVKEKASMTQEEATKAYQQLKQARRDYEKAAAKNLLTEHDEQRIGELLRGQIQLENLDPKTDNVRGITQVYEARKEYERIAKRLKEYKGDLRKKGRERADGYLTTSGAWKDKSAGIFYSRETMERNIRDIVPDKKLANDIIREYFTPVHEAQAASTREKNKYRERVKKLNLSRKVAEGNEISEAHAVQLLGEAEDNIRVLLNSKGRMKQRDGKSLEDWQGIVTNLWEQNPGLDRAKIYAAVKEFRDIYDELFGKMNEVRVRNGYEPVNYRQGYFPHFQPGSGDGILAQFGKIMGIDTQVIDLPTTINGMTHTFKPGITWFGNSQQRLGFATAYDAVEGFDKYIEGVMDVIHHTDNIQNLRALASQIRYRASDDGIREQVDAMRANDTLTEEQKEDQIAAIYEKGKYALSNFVAELDEYTNLLANKKSKGDRSMEQAMGRRAYIFMKNMESRVAANMVAINPGSWLTNFIPITQGAASIKTRLILRGMWDTLRAGKENDGFVDRSAFLTNRRGSDPLVRTWSQNFSAKATKPMEWIDNITSETLVRARYQHNLEHKMSEDAAMREADAWTASIMADRSKGATPTLFSQKNPFTKLFTQFQLEVNNQYSYLLKDLPDEVKERGLAVLAGAFFKFFLGAFLYNELYEHFIGRRPALDPFGMLIDAVEDFQMEEVGTYEALAGLGGDIAEQIPFVGGILGGGRVPISSAMPDVPNLVKAATDENWSAEKKAATVVKEMANPLSYLVLPFGGGQAKKIIQGVNAVNDRGSYSVDSEGNKKLQYPVFADTKGEYAANMLRATVFGKSSLPEAVDWVESGFKGLSAKETAAYQKLLDAGASGRDSYELLSQLDGEERNKAVADKNLSDEATLDIFSELMSAGEYVRVGIGYEFGLSPKLYAQARYLMEEYNADGEGGIKQDEAEAAIRSIDGLNTSQRAVLWQVQNKGWSGKSNPFSAKIGERVKGAFDAMNEDEEQDAVPAWISLPTPE